jgi:hypothetical protein
MPLYGLQASPAMTIDAGVMIAALAWTIALLLPVLLRRFVFRRHLRWPSALGLALVLALPTGCLLSSFAAGWIVLLSSYMVSSVYIAGAQEKLTEPKRYHGCIGVVLLIFIFGSLTSVTMWLVENQ